MVDSKLKASVIYNEYNNSIDSATVLMVDGDNSAKSLKLQVAGEKLEISIFNELEEEEGLLSLNKRELLQFIKLMNDVAKPLRFPAPTPEISEIPET